VISALANAHLSGAAAAPGCAPGAGGLPPGLMNLVAGAMAGGGSTQGAGPVDATLLGMLGGLGGVGLSGMGMGRPGPGAGGGALPPGMPPTSGPPPTGGRGGMMLGPSVPQYRCGMQARALCKLVGGARGAPCSGRTQNQAAPHAASAAAGVERERQRDRETERNFLRSAPGPAIWGPAPVPAAFTKPSAPRPARAPPSSLDKERRIHLHFRVTYMTKWGQSVALSGTGGAPTHGLPCSWGWVRSPLPALPLVLRK
jgi:hypothetical protein